MNYLAVLWDNEHSYEFSEQDLPKVEMAMKMKAPFKFADGTVVAGGDIRRIEKAGGGELNTTTRIDMSYLEQLFLAPPTDVKDGFWFNVLRLNRDRLVKKQPHIFNSTIDYYRERFGLNTADEVFAAVVEDFNAEDYAKQDKTRAGNGVSVGYVPRRTNG